MTTSRIEAGAGDSSSQASGTRLDSDVAELFAKGAATERGARTRAALVAAASACFAEFGYNSTRIADIVQNAGVAHGSFYRHFAGKGEILVAVIEPCVRDLLETSRRTEPGEDERSALIRATTAYFTTYARHRHLMRVTREASAADPEGFAELWLRIRGEFTRRNVRWVNSLVRRGVIDPDCDVEMLAESLGAMTDQLAYVKIGVPREAPRAEQLTRMGRAAGDIWYRALPFVEP
ncbi:TetR/AcrR family transcriptional regulator [Saccharopolyspora sp. WRP15-2]|uniref:TetR/AcrR family transcriptional regulator n=1 Tax=Saccharopolyspora oryzae TaxID=2997343 RepID=A0ABT4V4D2_9PSEU|nr:TetR/AcrR family transcriptional regulator [Saccharopolyspora oryzae]MDA3628819.1 TetR/AcrR family transcriptional regulator [Saccharopolyspora oryzae]